MRFLSSTSLPGKRGNYFLTRMLTGFVTALTLLSCGGGDGDAAATARPVAALAAAATPTLSLVAGALGGSGNIDGLGELARFDTPYGVAVADDGTAYIADTGNHVIRKIAPDGEVSVFAGMVGISGSANGSATTTARFAAPYGVAVTRDGSTVYVADADNHTIRRIRSGVVDIVAGAAGTAGATNGDGSGASARFVLPAGLALHDDAASDVLYVTDASNAVRKVVITDTAVTVSTLAGTFGVAGAANGMGAAASFKGTAGLGLSSDGALLYVADSGNHLVRVIETANGMVDTLAGQVGVSGDDDGTGTAASFDSPLGVAVAADAVYVTDMGNTVRKITLAREVSTFAGTAGEEGSDDGSAAAARFRGAAGIFHLAGKLYVADTFNHAIRAISVATAEVSTLAGRAPVIGTDNGIGATARFNQPVGLAINSAGMMYVADVENHAIRQITPAGDVGVLAGSPGTSGAANGTAGDARFKTPFGVAVGSDGTIYVADTGNNAIRRVTPAGVVDTLAGTPGASAAATDGTGPDAGFNSPAGLALDTAGNVYVADTDNHTIRKITPAGVTTTIAGEAGIPGARNSTTALSARFRLPGGIALDAEGNIYIADTGNHVIRKLDTSGNVSTLAGKFGNPGKLDGSGSGAQFNSPLGAAVDADGNVYVSDAGNSTIRRITPGGTVTTIVGVAGAKGVALGELPAGLRLPLGLALGMDGNLYLVDENAVLKAELAAPINMFKVSLGASAATITLGQSVTLSWSTSDAENCSASNAWTGPRDVYGSETITPAAVGSFTYMLSCSEAGDARTQSKSVTVQVNHPSPVINFSASAPVIAPGGSSSLTWSTANVTSCTASGAWPDATTPGLSGTLTVTPPEGSHSYTLACSGPGGSATKTVKVNVGHPPTLTLTASAASITYGEKVRLNWTTTHATTCTATGGYWSGVKTASGSEEVEPAFVGDLKYTLSCSGLAGTVTQFVYVEVKEGKTGSGAGGGGGGAGPLGLDMLAGLGLLALWRRPRRGRHGS